MQKRRDKRNSGLKVLPGIILFIPAILITANSAISKEEQCEPGSAVCAVDSNDTESTSSADIKMLRKKVEQFLSLDDSNPVTLNSHIYFNIATEILPHNELLDLTEKVIKKGIEVNTIKNLRKTHPDMSESGIKQQQKLEFGRLYSQYAWLLRQKNQPDNAYNAITKAINYISSPTPNDYIRLGIIEYETGKKQKGWDHITKALLTDTIIEEQYPAYRKALYKIIEDKYAAEKEPTIFIDEYRSQNAQMIPNLSLLTLKNEKINTHQHVGQVIFINFFSPSCGSCQQEIPSLINLYKKLSPGKNLVIIFILNRPDLKQQAIDLFEKSGIDKPTIAVLENGTVWDYIEAEPSIWIADKSGKAIFRHSGYKQGDELIYQKKLSKLIKN